MQKFLAVLMVTLIFAACTGEKGGSDGISFDTREDYEKALASGKPTIVEFSATWCTICLRMAPVVEKMKAKYGDRVNIIILNLDKEKALVKKYGIRGAPTFVLLNSKGEVVGGAVGYIPEDRFEEMILELLEK